MRMGCYNSTFFWKANKSIGHCSCSLLPTQQISQHIYYSENAMWFMGGGTILNNKSRSAQAEAKGQKPLQNIC